MEIPLTESERKELSEILSVGQYSRAQALFINDMSVKYMGKAVCLTCGGKLRTTMRELLK